MNERVRLPFMEAHPKVVQVYIGDICNLRCSFCIPRQQSWSEGKQWVNGDAVDRDIDPKILDGISPVFETADWLYLTGGGEPFACKAFWEFIEGKRASNGIAVNSNGVLITEKNIDRLLKYPKKLNIGFSFNAATRETYKKVVGTDAFDVITKNCKNLLARRGERTEPLSVFASMTVMKDNLHEVVPFVRMCKEVGVDLISINTAMFPYDYSWPVDPKFNSQTQYVLGDPNMSAEFDRMWAEAEALAGSLGIPITGHDGHDSKWLGPCRELFDFLVIKQDGESNACCMKWDIKTGNIKDFPSFDAMWNSPVRQDMRRSVLKGEFPKPCQTAECPYFRVAEKRRAEGSAPVLAFPDTGEAPLYRAAITGDVQAVDGSSNDSMTLHLSVTNAGAMSWHKSAKDTFTVGARLYSDGTVVREYRAMLPDQIRSGEELQVGLNVHFAGIEAGSYELRIDAVREGEFWFEDQGSVAAKIAVHRAIA